MIKNYLFAVLLAVFALVGCGSTPIRTVEIVNQQTMIVVEPDPMYLEDCQVEPPVTAAEFAKMTKDEREDYLARVTIKQYKYLRLCTNDKRHLKSQVEKQKKEIEAFNAKQKEAAEKRKETILKGGS